MTCSHGKNRIHKTFQFIPKGGIVDRSIKFTVKISQCLLSSFTTLNASDIHTMTFYLDHQDCRTHLVSRLIYEKQLVLHVNVFSDINENGFPKRESPFRNDTNNVIPAVFVCKTRARVLTSGKQTILDIILQFMVSVTLP